MKPTITTLLVDVDNTLFDWVAYWKDGFMPSYQSALPIFGHDEKAAQKAIRDVHIENGTSEYAFLDLAIPGVNPFAKIKPEPFPGVLETLKAIKAKGTKLIAYTESMEHYSATRLISFGLDGLLDRVYCNKDHKMPKGFEPCRLVSTPTFHIPDDSTKPDPDFFTKVLAENNADPATTAYIGDNLYKDITMANACGVHDVYAQYGNPHYGSDLYTLLAAVSFWTDEAIQKDRAAAKNAPQIPPTYTLHTMFSEIFDHFEFTA